MNIRNRQYSTPPSAYQIAFCAVLLCIVGIMLLCNRLTPYIVDDYSYMFSFATGERLHSLKDILPSMAAHRLHVNGRIVAHTIVQVFSLLPAWLFDIANSSLFVLLILGIVRIADAHQHRIFISVCAFCLIWLFCPAFGQVFLWQDGSINYHWSFLLVIAYLIPFVDCFLHNRTPKSAISKILYLLCAVFTGAYTEVASFGAIVLSALLLVMCRLYCKKKCTIFYCLMIVCACIGYISIYLAPAQWINKSNEFVSNGLCVALFRALHGYRKAGTLLIPYAVLLIICLWARADTKRVLLSIAFIFASIAANTLTIAAKWYPDRVASGVFIYILIANVILLNILLSKDELRMPHACAMAVLLLLTANALLNGIADITSTYWQLQNNKEAIAWHKECGYTNATVPIVKTSTRYSALNGLTYLRTDKEDVWPNTSVAKYYELESIIGYDEEWVISVPLTFVNEP